MPRSLTRLLLALAALAFVAGACSSSGDDDDADADEDTEQVDSTDETTDEDADADDEADIDEDEDADAGDEEEALSVLEGFGFSGESGDCILASLEDQGIDISDLDEGDVTSPSSELTDAFAQAGADCVDVISGGDLPAGSTDLSDPQVYDAFVDGFVSTSGLSREVAECVADYFVDNDVDPLDVLESGGRQAVTDAVAACQ